MEIETEAVHINEFGGCDMFAISSEITQSGVNQMQELQALSAYPETKNRNVSIVISK